MPAKQVAVISAHDDAHLSFVEKHLEQPLLRIDPQDIAHGAALSFVFDRSTARVIYKGQDITNLRGIWLRKPQPIDAATLPVADAYKNYSRSALERLIAQLTTAFPHANWLSALHAQNQANNKAFQLAVAQKCGFNVAPTLFTSNPEAAKAFIAEQESCITKPLAVQFPRINGKQLSMMTTKIGPEFMPKLAGLRIAPAIFQKALDVDIEVRATVVDMQVFAASVRVQHAAHVTAHDQSVTKHIRDNRQRHTTDTLQIESFALPKGIADMCVEHCKLLGLPFGALDLIRDTEGTWWFLENNPNGQWAFVEEATALPIGKAIAAYLQQ